MDGSIQRQGIVITKNKDIQEGDQVQIYNIGYQLYFGNKRFISRRIKIYTILFLISLLKMLSSILSQERQKRI